MVCSSPYRSQTWFLFSSFLKASVRKAPAAALCTFISVDSNNSTRGGMPPSTLKINIWSKQYTNTITASAMHESTLT